MPSTILLIGGPYHMRKMSVDNNPPQFEVQRSEALNAHLVGPVKAFDEVEIRTLTYRPRSWFGCEVWVLDELTDSVAIDLLLTSAFNKGRR